MPLDKPCAAVSTLESMAYCMPLTSGIVCAVMDARCSQVYNALFRIDNGNVGRITEDRALSLTELEEELSGYYETVYLIGDGAQLCFDSFGRDADNIVLTPENIRFQHAYGTAAAAAKMASENRLCSCDELMPVYLRLPQAERELKARQAQSKA